MLSANRILLPYDFSSEAKQALRYAAGLAARTGAALHLLCAEVLYGQPPLPSEGGAALTKTRDHLDRVIEQQAGRLAADRASVRFASAVRRDVAAAPAIVRYADECSADLIVMGTRGRSGLRHLMLGSTAEQVLRHAPCPVFTVRARPSVGVPDRSPVFPDIARILAPTDAYAPSREALRRVKTLAADLGGAQVELFHAVEETLHPAFYGPAVQSVYDAQPNIEEEAARQLEMLYRATGGPSMEELSGAATFTAAPGPAPQAIAKRARTAGGADLIVMATRGRTGWAHLTGGGSVAEKVIRQAPCPVLTFRRASASQTRAAADAQEAHGAQETPPAAAA